MANSSAVRPPSSSAAWKPADADRTDSPSTMIVKSPYRSSMCPAWNTGAPAARSAHTGTASSAATRTRNPAVAMVPWGRASRANHNTCSTEMPAA